MRHVLARTSLLLASVAGMLPARLTPDPSSRRKDDSGGFEITTLGVVGGQSAAPVTALRAGLSQKPTHALFTVTVEPGASLPNTFAYSSLVMHVQKGRVQVVANGGEASISVGTGQAIRESPRGKLVLCASGTVPLADGQVATLGVGNGLSLADGVLDVVAYGKVPAQVQLSVVLTPDDTSNQLCWICPKAVTLPY